MIVLIIHYTDNDYKIIWSELPKETAQLYKNRIL